jgi:AraC-like DNA-binding protein
MKVAIAICDKAARRHGCISLKTVAFECGFRTSFARRLAVTPKQYRQRFRVDVGKQPSVKSVNNGGYQQASLQGLSAL